MVKKSVKSSQECNETAQNFKTSYLGLGMNFLDIFRAKNDCLVVGYLMGKKNLNLVLICACGSCLKRVIVKAFWLILQKVPKLEDFISWARNGQIKNFKRLKS